MKAIIIGGGIGGLCAGLALQQLGHEIAIFEQAAEIRPVGAGLSIWKNGLAALRSLGLDNGFLAGGAVQMVGTVRAAKGEILSQVRPEMLGEPVANLVRVFHRADLQQALLDAVGPQNVHLGKVCTRVEQHVTEATAIFADGSRVSGDYLIGADGLNSIVRRQLHGRQPATYAGYTAWRAVIPFDLNRLKPGESWGAGARFGQVPVDAERVYWFATHNEAAGGQAPNGERAYLLDLFAGWHDPIPALIAAADEAAILRNDIFDRPPLNRWGSGRVTLLGDAAHPMTPNMGQGACQAMEDAVVLRNCLRQEGTVEAALRRYEHQRIERTTKFVRQSRRIGQLGQLDRSTVLALRNALIKLLPARLQLNQLLRLLAFEPEG